MESEGEGRKCAHSHLPIENDNCRQVTSAATHHITHTISHARAHTLAQGRRGKVTKQTGIPPIPSSGTSARVLELHTQTHTPGRAVPC